MQIFVLVILIFLNAFFASSEIAFISLNDKKISMMAKEGNKKAKSIEKMLKTPSKFLATIQIGITLAGFLSSAFASDAFADQLAPFLNSVFPMISVATFRGISIILITIILSYFTLIFGELVPKRIAMKNSEAIAFGTIGVIKFISIVTAPFVKFLTASTDLVSKLFGVSEEVVETVTEEEIRMMVDVGNESGSIDAQEKELINNIFDFDDRIVSEIMTHRTEIFALDMESTVADFEEIPDNCSYSRVPVYEDTIDDIQGILYVKDMIKVLKTPEGRATKIKDMINEAYFVPESKKINELFKELKLNKKQMAIVLDEYGGTAGLVTMEDILEAIVGEIFDEYDDEEQPYTKISEDEYIVEGNIGIYEINKLLNIKIPDGEYDTLTGYLMEEIGRVPEENELFELDKPEAIYRVKEYDERKIVSVYVKIKPQPETESDEEDEEEEKKANVEETESNS